MAAKGLIVLVCLFVLPSSTQASPRPPPCCERYTRSRVPFQYVVDVKVQSANEHCRIDAIILVTVKQREICVTQDDKWVQIIMQKLSEKLKKKKMSKSGNGKIPVRKNRRPSIPDGSGHL